MSTITHKLALPMPPQVVGSPEDGSVVELARVWFNKDQPAIFVRPSFDDPRAMGLMLAELCWQFADAYQAERGVNQAEALEAMKVGWEEGHRRAQASFKPGTPQ